MDRYDNLASVSNQSTSWFVVEAYRLDRYDNMRLWLRCPLIHVVEAYRLDRYDNFENIVAIVVFDVVEAYRLDRYDNIQDYAP